MPRDARLGFVIGVAAVILIAVVFYHGDGKIGLTGSVGAQVIDTEKGAIASATALPPEQSPGNLLLCEGDIISQTADRLTVYSAAK